jgi:hypothetical protein
MDSGYPSKLTPNEAMGSGFGSSPEPHIEQNLVTRAALLTA